MDTITTTISGRNVVVTTTRNRAGSLVRVEIDPGRDGYGHFQWVNARRRQGSHRWRVNTSEVYGPSTDWFTPASWGAKELVSAFVDGDPDMLALVRGE